VLAQHRALVHVHHQAEDEGEAHAHAARLVHVPEHQHHGQQVGRGRVAATGQHFQQQRAQQRQRDEERVDRQQQLVVARAHPASLMTGAPATIRPWRAARG
jgi:hypothetical protein